MWAAKCQLFLQQMMWKNTNCPTQVLQAVTSHISCSSAHLVFTSLWEIDLIFRPIKTLHVEWIYYIEIFFGFNLRWTWRTIPRKYGYFPITLHQWMRMFCLISNLPCLFSHITKTFSNTILESALTQDDNKSFSNWHSTIHIIW